MKLAKNKKIKSISFYSKWIFLAIFIYISFTFLIENYAQKRIYERSSGHERYSISYICLLHHLIVNETQNTLNKETVEKYSERCRFSYEELEKYLIQQNPSLNKINNIIPRIEKHLIDHIHETIILNGYYKDLKKIYQNSSDEEYQEKIAEFSFNNEEYDALENDLKEKNK